MILRGIILNAQLYVRAKNIGDILSKCCQKLKRSYISEYLGIQDDQLTITG